MIDAPRIERYELHTLRAPAAQPSCEQRRQYTKRRLVYPLEVSRGATAPTRSLPERCIAEPVRDPAHVAIPTLRFRPRRRGESAPDCVWIVCPAYAAPFF